MLIALIFIHLNESVGYVSNVFYRDFLLFL
jgi:hypothetical protein